jgi:hypothetical protein
MEEFKILLFESEYKLSFPGYEVLSTSACEKLINSIAGKHQIDISNFEQQLTSMQSFYKRTDALEGFNLLNTLTELKIKPLSKVFLNWYRYEKIDVFKIDDVDNYFYSIWFPSSDDIDLFDESLSWILSIRHDGFIGYIKWI